jgi:uncharacterized protein with PIN domain
MPSVLLRFYAELNDFLPPSRRQAEFAQDFGTGAAVKDIVEAAGVPHTEIDLIVAGGRSVGFDYRPRDGEHISVYPIFESVDVTPVLHLRPAPLRDTRFVLDVHLGKLARLLRLLGFDARYGHDLDDAELARISRDERRILLTRDRGVLKRSGVTHGTYVRASQAEAQAVEVLRRFDLSGAVRPFTRCPRCNGLLRPVAKADVLDRLEPKTRLYFDDFRQCASCGQVYWQGSHAEPLQAALRRITNRASGMDASAD